MTIACENSKSPSHNRLCPSRESQCDGALYHPPLRMASSGVLQTMIQAPLEPRQRSLLDWQASTSQPKPFNRGHPDARERDGWMGLWERGGLVGRPKANIPDELPNSSPAIGPRIPEPSEEIWLFAGWLLERIMYADNSHQNVMSRARSGDEQIAEQITSTVCWEGRNAIFTRRWAAPNREYKDPEDRKSVV